MTMKERWEDPVYRAKRHASAVLAQNRPDVIASRVATIRKQWASGERDKVAMVNSMHSLQAMAKRKEKLVVTKQLLSAASKKRWEDPTVKKTYLKHLQTFSKAPEQRAANSARLKAKWADPIFRAKMIAARKDSYTPERIAQWRAGRTDETPWSKGLTKDTDPRLKRMSVKRQGKIPNYSKYRAWYRCKGKAIYMRSKWEVAFAQFLDSKRIKWEYEPKYFSIGTGNWNGTSYIPDFYIPKKKLYIELKGRLTAINERKIAAFKTQYPDVAFKMLFRQQLIKLGVLDARGCAILARGKK